MNRPLLVVVSLVLIEGTIHAAAQTEGGAETRTIDVVALYSEKQTEDQLGFGGRLFTSHLQEVTGITINWRMMLRDRYSIKILVASDDLGDLLVAEGLLRKADVDWLVKSDVIVPLDEMIAEYARDMFGALDSIEGRVIRERLTMPDGNVYSFPYIDVCFWCQYPVRMSIYKPWVDALRLPWPPETTEDYRSVLKRFKDGDANGNGRPDEVPLIGSMVLDSGALDPTGFLMNAFVYVQSPVFSRSALYLVRHGMSIEFSANTEQWRDGLRYLRVLFEEGLLDADSFSLQREDALTRIAFDNPRYVGSFASGWYDVAEFEAIAPLEGSNGRQATFRAPRLWFSSLITTKDRDTIRAITELINWWFVDPVEANYRCSNFWEEGQHWRRLTEEEKELGLVASDGLLAETVWMGKASDVTGRFEGWGDSCFARWRGTSAVVPTSSREWRLIVDTGELYAPYTSDKFVPPDMMFSQEEEEEMSRLRQEVVTVVQEAAAKFIRGYLNIDDDGDWSDYLSDLESNGVDRYVEIWQGVVDRHGDSVEAWGPFIDHLRTQERSYSRGILDG